MGYFGYAPQRSPSSNQDDKIEGDVGGSMGIIEVSYLFNPDRK